MVNTIFNAPSPIFGRGVKVANKFDPQGDGFDMDRATVAGMRRSTTPGPNFMHLGSVAPVTPQEINKFKLPKGSFIILKGRRHPTFNKAVQAELARGFEVVERGGRFFSIPRRAP